MRTTSKSIRSIIYGIITIAVIAAFLNVEKSWFSQEEPVVLAAEVDQVTKPLKDNFNMNSQLRFIVNHGQAGEDAEYHVQGVGHTVLFYKDKVEFRKIVSATQKNEVVLQFEDANQNPIIEGVDKLRGVANFFKGSDQRKWQTNVPTYASVLYKELYPGIDMAYIGSKGDLESEFYVSPGIDYHQIKLNYSGVQSKKIRDDGALVLETALGELVENTPIAFQEINGVKHDVDVQYAMLDDKNIGFELGNYNLDFAVVIDPLLMFGRVVEGAVGGGEFGEDIAIDSEGNIIVVGGGDRFFPATDNIEGSQHEGGSSNDGIIIKTDGVTGEIIYSALFGGSKQDYFKAIAVDNLDNIYLTGLTKSIDFPVADAAQTNLAGDFDAFMVILNSSFEISKSTYLGGIDRDWGDAIAVDGEGSAYVVGRTSSTDFPVINGYQMAYGGGSNSGFPSDAFVSKYNSTGAVVYATYLGGAGDDGISGIKVNSTGEATVTGRTGSEDFPLANAYQGTYGGGGIDIFVSRFNSSGDGLVYSTYMGGEKDEWSYDMAMDSDGRVCVAGGTFSDEFPIVNGESNPETWIADGILILLDNSGQPVYSVRTNRPGYDEFKGVVINDNNIVFAIGENFLETIATYHKSETDPLGISFEVEALGYDIWGVDLKGNNIAMTGSYWEPVMLSSNPLKKGSSYDRFGGSGSKVTSINYKVDLIKLFMLFTTGGVLENKSASDIIIIEVVDVYFDELLVADNVELNAVQISSHDLQSPTILVEITDSEATDNSNPLASFTLNLKEDLEGGNYNLYDQSSFIFYEVEDGIFNSLLKKDLRTEGSDPTKVEIFIAHTAGDALGMVDLQLVDNSSPPNVLQTLFDDIPTESVTDYVSFDPDEVTFQITNADNSQQYGLYNYDLSSYTGQALVGTIVPDSLDIMARELLLFDTLGTKIESTVVSIDENILDAPSAFELSSNYPNPFSSSTIIYYSLPESSQVSLKIYNSAGQEIETLVDELQQGGSYEVTFNADDLPGGIYFYSITANDFVSVKKMLIK